MRDFDGAKAERKGTVTCAPVPLQLRQSGVGEPGAQGVIQRDRQGAGEGVGGHLGDRVFLPPVVHQPQPDQAIECGGGGADAGGLPGRLQRAAGNRQPGGEQAGRPQQLGLGGGEGLAVGVKGHALEEGQGGVAGIRRCALVDQALDVGGRYAVLLVVPDVGHGLGGHLGFADKDGAGEDGLKARIAVGEQLGLMQQGLIHRGRAVLPGQARGAAQLLAPVGLVHGLERNGDEGVRQIVAPGGGQAEAVAAGDQEARFGACAPEGVEDGGEGGAKIRPERRGGGIGRARRFQDALQVVDDQQDGAGVEGAIEQGLQGIRKLASVGEDGVAPGVDDRPPFRSRQGLAEPVENGEGVVAAEDHHFGVAGVAGGNAVGQAGLAQVAHAVNQHALFAAPEGADHILGGAPAPDELAPPCNGHLLVGGVEELFLATGGLALGLAPGGKGAAALGAEVETGQVPVPAF